MQEVTGALFPTDLCWLLTERSIELGAVKPTKQIQDENIAQPTLWLPGLFPKDVELAGLDGRWASTFSPGPQLPTDMWGFWESESSPYAWVGVLTHWKISPDLEKEYLKNPEWGAFGSHFLRPHSEVERKYVHNSSHISIHDTYEIRWCVHVGPPQKNKCFLPHEIQTCFIFPFN